ncbi:MAG: hypothetical protein ABR987_13645 [Terracidiphilus sp.]|jgi:hypothetical protein
MSGAMGSIYRSRLKFGAAALIAAIPGCGLLFLLQRIGGFTGSWTWYVSGFLFYTVLVFGNAYIEDESILFSSGDHRSKLKLIAVHCFCVGILFALIQGALYIRPFLPPSLLAAGTRRVSWMKLLFCALLMAVFFVEENWLAVKGTASHAKKR